MLYFSETCRIMKRKVVISVIISLSLLLAIICAIVIYLTLRPDHHVKKATDAERQQLANEFKKKSFQMNTERRVYNDFLYFPQTKSKLDFTSKTILEVIPAPALDLTSWEIFKLGEDHKTFLLRTNVTHLAGGRHRDVGYYYLYDNDTSLSDPRGLFVKETVLDLDEYHEVRNDETRKKLLTGISPTGNNQSAQIRIMKWTENSHAVIFNVNGTLYYHEDPFQNTPAVEIISTSEPSVMSYGYADWLYEEEILLSSSAIWWNPSGDKVLFMSFDDSDVSQIRFPYYGDSDKIYADIRSYRVPMAGETKANNNPRVQLHVFDIAQKTVLNLTKPQEMDNIECYVNQPSWLTTDTFVAFWNRRDWSVAYLGLYSMNVSTWTILHTVQVEKKGAALFGSEEQPHVLYAKETNQLFVIAPNANASPAMYFNVLQIDLITKVKLWLPTDFDIIKLLHVNVKSNALTVSAAYPTTYQENVLQIHLENGNFTCLTCQFKDRCQYTLSPDVRYYLQYCWSFPDPTAQLLIMNETLQYFAGPFITGEKIAHKFASLKLPQAEIKSVTIRPTQQSKVTVNMGIIYPTDFYKDQKYPLLLFVYGGPGSQTVINGNFHRNVVHAISMQCVVLMVDGRGTNRRGLAFINELYQQAGVVDVADQIDSVKEFLKEGFIDASRLAVYGWSYGGFLSGHIIGSSAEPAFKCGLLGAPVTDFRYYDTAYTERFLGLLNDSQEAYKHTSIMSKVQNMVKKKILLVHGSADDNVRFLNSMQLMSRMHLAGVDFNFLVYKDAAHNPQRTFENDSSIFLNSCFHN